AVRAVRAADDMRAGLAELATVLERDRGVRLVAATGVNTGEVVAGDASLGQRLVTGDAVNVAARLEQAANVHEVLIGDLTHLLVQDTVDVEAVAPLALKGKAQPVPAYRLLHVRSGIGVARRLDTPMVGRDQELGLLRTRYHEAIEDRRPRMITVIGEAGVGKSRLTQEFVGVARQDALVLTGRCLAYGEAITFWPIAELVRQAASIGDEDPPEVGRARLAALLGPVDDGIADRVAAAVGLSDAPFQLAELFWGIRRFLEVLSQTGPVVVLLDDIHWAETTFLDLVMNLVDTIQDAPVMILCTARHALLDDHPGWAMRTHEALVELAPLTTADTERVVENLLGQAGLAEQVSQRIVAAAEGNPLFVEQLLSMLIDNGSLRVEGERWCPWATSLGWPSRPRSTPCSRPASTSSPPRSVQCSSRPRSSA
ncbi:MAG: ATP-binding protein, partial [Candidatus Limnocylindrales bacterium]